MASNDHQDDDDEDDDDDDVTDKQVWNLISDVMLENKAQNVIEFTERSNGWRLLKIEILDHYGSEYYCTATQIKVFGSTMLAHWKNDVLSHLEKVEEIKQNITNNTNITIPRSDRKASPKQDGENKQLSVFSILTKRITSLELNLTKQQLQVSHLMNLFGKIDELNDKFDDYQMNVTNHILFQSYGISMLLKSLKDGGNQSNDDDDGVDKPDWSTPQKSYYQDLPSWQRQEQLERIENYMQNMEVMMSYILWIGVIIIISQIIIAITLAVYVCRCCDNGVHRHSHHSHNLKTNKHRVTTPKNGKSSTKNRFFSRSFSQSVVGLKKGKNKRKF